MPKSLSLWKQKFVVLEVYTARSNHQGDLPGSFPSLTVAKKAADQTTLYISNLSTFRQILMNFSTYNQKYNILIVTVFLFKILFQTIANVSLIFFLIFCHFCYLFSFVFCHFCYLFLVIFYPSCYLFFFVSFRCEICGSKGLERRTFDVSSL